MRDLAFRTRFRWKLRPRHVTGDTKYGTTDNIVALEREHIHAYVPIADLSQRTPFFRQADFRYDATRDVHPFPPQARSCIFCQRQTIERSLYAIARGPRTAITVRSKPSVRPVRRAAASAAVSMSSIWIGSEATTRPKPTKRPCASVRSGWSRYLPKPKTGMACVVSV